MFGSFLGSLDDLPTCDSYYRYNYCRDNLTPYLKKIGFNPAKDLKFMPCSGLSGAGLMDSVGSCAPWYRYVVRHTHSHT